MDEGRGQRAGVPDQRRDDVPRRAGACLKWLDENEPQSLDRAATAGYFKDGIFGRLTGERACDPSDSSMPLGDGTGMGYSDKTLEIMGLSHRKNLLAPIVAPVPVGELRADAAPSGSGCRPASP